MAEEGGGPPKRVPFFAELLEGTLQAAAEDGAEDERRALSYLVNNYPPLYEQAAEAYGRGFLPTEVEVRPSGLSPGRKVMDLIFSFTNYDTEAAEKYRARVDVTEESPTLLEALTKRSDN
ncbi:MAG TPA: hypothetical protein VF546_02945 [Pyrinomonadaceae bacterium]|jgi:hypothetical protein